MALIEFLLNRLNECEPRITVHGSVRASWEEFLQTLRRSRSFVGGPIYSFEILSLIDWSQSPDPATMRFGLPLLTFLGIFSDSLRNRYEPVEVPTGRIIELLRVFYHTDLAEVLVIRARNGREYAETTNEALARFGVRFSVPLPRTSIPPDELWDF